MTDGPVAGRWLEPTDERWRRSLERLRHDVYHLPAWAEHEAEASGARPLAFCFERADRLFFLPLLLRPIPGSELPDAASPYGYPGPLASAGAGAGFLGEAIEALVAALDRLEAVSAIVRLHPLAGVEPRLLAGRGELVRHGETVAIDLTAGEEKIWSGVRPSHRQRIRQARRAGLTARADPSWDGFEAFLAIYEATMLRVGADAGYRFSRRYFEGLRRRLGDRLHLHLVESAGQVAAAGLFTEVDGTVQFHLSGTHAEFVRLGPSKLLIDGVWRWARRRGAGVLHLGGGVGAAADSLFEFKAGFSRWRLPFHTWRLVVRAAAYERLAGDAGEPPDAGGEGFFPAYRRAAG